MTTPLTLKEFLLTASEDHEQATIEANEYQPLPYLWRIEGSIRKTQVETGLIINNTEARLRSMIAENSGASELQKDIAAKIVRAIEKLYHPEFYINLTDQEVAQLFSAAHALGVLNLDEVTRITQAAMYFPDKPFQVTLHDVLVTRDVCPVKQVFTDDGWIIVRTSADCPRHNPRLLVKNPRRDNILQPINSIHGVSTMGVYETQVPRAWFGDYELYVDDPYGVM